MNWKQQNSSLESLGQKPEFDFFFKQQYFLPKPGGEMIHMCFKATQIVIFPEW